MTQTRRLPRARRPPAALRRHVRPLSHHGHLDFITPPQPPSPILSQRPHSLLRSLSVSLTPNTPWRIHWTMGGTGEVGVCGGSWRRRSRAQQSFQTPEKTLSNDLRDHRSARRGLCAHHDRMIRRRDDKVIAVPSHMIARGLATWRVASSERWSRGPLHGSIAVRRRLSWHCCPAKALFIIRFDFFVIHPKQQP